MVSRLVMCPPMSYQTHNYIMFIPKPRLLFLSALETYLLPDLALAAVSDSLAINSDYFCTFELIWYFNQFSVDIWKQNNQKTTCNLRRISFL